MSRTVSTRVMWITAAAFLMVNGAIIGRQIVAKRRAMPAESEATPMVAHGGRVTWSGHDILGRPVTIPCDTADVLIVEVDLNQGREALELARILQHGRPRSGVPIVLLAATGNTRSLARLSQTGSASMHVVTRHSLDTVLGSRPERSLAMGRVVIIGSDALAGLTMLKAGPRDLQV
ncbi:hypothetical protein JXA88_12245, partial [Candidatus Fermentibacteria bacterium]|nr:hypothetical protein [Candidatus Fermentibacteria bacterium]